MASENRVRHSRVAVTEKSVLLSTARWVESSEQILPGSGEGPSARLLFAGDLRAATPAIHFLVRASTDGYRGKIGRAHV